ncbi:hypothetical protein I4U23_011489 [Adineta vaga]|nr:hypothetical protein I4U23_011489 [Adineta vaga]
MEKQKKEQQKTFLGYQLNEKLNYSEKLSFMLDIHTNNVGDPFVNGNCTTNTKVIERAVLDYFANLWHAQYPSDPANEESYWGYILSMGCTEGNLYALYNARNYLQGKALYREADQDFSYVGSLKENVKTKNAYHPVAFFSQDTHYSIAKAVRVLEIRTFCEIGEAKYKGQCPITQDGRWPREVPSEYGNEGPGSIDVDKLVQLVEFFAKKGYPPLIVLNLGTTFKGAYDDVEKVGNLLQPILETYKLATRKVNYAPGTSDNRTGYWIHVDGALGGSYLPFLKKAGGRVQGHIPKFDFSLPFVHSIVTSAHKYPGSPMPGGIYMTKRKYQIAPPDDPEYTGSPDTTFAGSRNGIVPAIMWCYYASTSDEIESDRAVKMEETAQYAETKLKELENEYQNYGYKLWVQRAPLSLSIRFRDPENHEIIRKYSLSQMKLQIDGETKPRKYVHIFIMQSVTNEIMDKLIVDLRYVYSETFFSIQDKVTQ